jgi:sterol desaturase/sphingolipid hydroxylase (fatty acid hydroxylase superfamily)
MADWLRTIYDALGTGVGWVFSKTWLPPKDFDLWTWLVVPGGGYGCVLIAFGLAELVFPQQKRPWNRATLLSSTYLLFTGKLGLYVLLVTPVFRKAWLHWDLPSLHLDQTLPLWAYIPLTLLVVTFTGYWAHRLMHRIPLLWHVHKIHHSATNLNWSSIYHRHVLELALHTPFHLTAVLLLGTDLVAPFGIVFMFIDVLGHSNARLDLGRLAYVISTPQAHRIHHSMEPRHFDRNFSNTFMWWDHVFGTFCYDPRDLPTRYGVDEPIPTSFLAQQALPFRWIARDLWAGIRKGLRPARLS